MSTTIKATVWIYMQNCGDGSAVPKFFTSEEDAEAYADAGDERFCEDVLRRTLEFDENGVLLNPAKLSDR
jgi:hypothetical protein